MGREGYLHNSVHSSPQCLLVQCPHRLHLWESSTPNWANPEKLGRMGAGGGQGWMPGLGGSDLLIRLEREIHSILCMEYTGSMFANLYAGEHLFVTPNQYLWHSSHHSQMCTGQ